MILFGWTETAARSPLTADPGRGWPCCSRSGPAARPFLVWQWLAYRAFLHAAQPVDRAALGGHDGVPLIASAAVEGPLALGLLDRRIVVPADFEPAIRAGRAAPGAGP